MHALAGLARSRPDYTQTVLDVLCAYLRRPYSHPRFEQRTDPDREAERELQVRLTAQRLVHDLLPPSTAADAPAYDLDLTGAAVEYLNLSKRRMGTVVLRYAHLRSDCNLSDCVFTGPVWFTSGRTGTGRLKGRFRCERTVFHQQAVFRQARFNSWVSFAGTTFVGEANFSRAVFCGDADFSDARFGAALNLRRARFEGSAALRWAGAPPSVALHETALAEDGEHALPDGWYTVGAPDGVRHIVAPPA